MTTISADGADEDDPGSSAKNWLGLVGLIMGLLWFGIPAVILGHQGLAAVKRREANNRPIALAAVIVGWVLNGLAVLIIVVLVAISSLDRGSADGPAGGGSGFGPQPTPTVDTGPEREETPVTP